jgi:hypothetical protein
MYPVHNDLTYAIQACNAWFIGNGYTMIADDQRACLADPARLDEAMDMVDDWEARVGLPGELRGDLVAALLDAAIAAGVEGIQS